MILKFTFRLSHGINVVRAKFNSQPIDYLLIINEFPCLDSGGQCRYFSFGGFDAAFDFNSFVLRAVKRQKAAVNFQG